MLTDAGVSPSLITDPQRPTTERSRIFLVPQLDVPASPSTTTTASRVDNLSTDGLADHTEQSLINELRELSSMDLIIIGEWPPHVFAPRVVEQVCQSMESSVIVVHPRRETLTKYMGLTKNDKINQAVLCIDIAEAHSIANLALDPDRNAVVQNLPAIAQSLMDSFEFFDCWAIRLGRFGAASVQRQLNAPRLGEWAYFEPRQSIAPLASPAVGCGAVFTAYLGMALATGAPINKAVALANFTAGIKYERRVEQGVGKADLMHAVRVDNHRVQPPIVAATPVGDREAQRILEMVQIHAAAGKIYLNEATKGFTVSAGYLPIIAYDPIQGADLDHLMNDIQEGSSRNHNVIACICGESRAGKTEVARSIHSAAGRSGEPVVLNCALENSLSTVLEALEHLSPGDTLILDELGQSTSLVVRDGLLDILNDLKDGRDDLLILGISSTHPIALQHNIFGLRSVLVVVQFHWLVYVNDDLSAVTVEFLCHIESIARTRRKKLKRELDFHIIVTCGADDFF